MLIFRWRPKKWRSYSDLHYNSNRCLPDAASEPTSQIRTEMPEGNRISYMLFYLPAHTASDQTGTNTSDQSRTAAEFVDFLFFFFFYGSDASERLRMRRREMCGVEGGGRCVMWSVCPLSVQKRMKRLGQCAKYTSTNLKRI